MRAQTWKGIRSIAVSAVALLAVCVPSLSHAQAVIRDTEIEAFLKKEARPVLIASHLDPDRVQFLIIASNDLNAFATSRLRIGLNTGLIMESETPNQLLGVIAHEAGHQSAGHTVRSDEIYQAAKVPMAISLGLGIIGILAGAPDAGAALLGSSSTFGTLGALRYMQTQESAADLAGVAALERAGMSGEGMVEFFDKFRQSETFSNAERYKYFRSHPLSRERIQTLRQVVQKQKNHNAKDSQGTIDEFAIVRAKLSGFLDQTPFVFQKYPETDQSYPARYARVIAWYKQTEVTKALAELDKLISEQPDNPYLWELKGQIYFETGQAELAKPAHMKSVELMPQAPLLHLNLGQTLIATNKEADLIEAVRHLKLSLQSEEDNSFTWSLLAQAYDTLKKPGEARLASAEAEFFNGNLLQARTFAVWSQANLDKNSPDFRRARDIVITTSAALGLDPVEDVTKSKKPFGN